MKLSCPILVSDTQICRTSVSTILLNTIKHDPVETGTKLQLPRQYTGVHLVQS